MRVAEPPPRAVRSVAIGFVIDAYAGVTVRPGKGLPHAQAVADVLRDAGADERTQILGLLHDVVEDTACSVQDVGAVFGDPLASMVDALTEDASVERYEQRKRRLRGRIAAAEPAVTDVALADKIASLRHAALTGTPVSKRKLAHYRATLRLGLAADAPRSLTGQLARVLWQIGAWPA